MMVLAYVCLVEHRSLLLLLKLLCFAAVTNRRFIVFLYFFNAFIILLGNLLNYTYLFVKKNIYRYFQLEWMFLPSFYKF